MTQGPNENTCGLVTCRVNELRSHPSYARRNFTVQASKLSALMDLGALAFQYPLVITTEYLIVDGYCRWELAKRTDRPTVQCIQYDLSPEEALEWLIQTHRSSPGLNDFVRIELALELEPRFLQKAQLNRQAGGRGKGLSKLTMAERVNSRREIARIADVAAGNVDKVKKILAKGCLAVQEAARSREISINRAEKWSRESQARQQENLRLRRIETGIRKKAKQIVANYVANLSMPRPQERTLDTVELIDLINKLDSMTPEQSNRLGKVAIHSVTVSGKGIFVTEELMQGLKPQQEVPNG